MITLSLLLMLLAPAFFALQCPHTANITDCTPGEMCKVTGYCRLSLYFLAAIRSLVVTAFYLRICRSSFYRVSHLCIMLHLPTLNLL